MPFGDNSHLLRTTSNNLVQASNGLGDAVAHLDKATSYSFTGGSGDDVLEGFDKNDTILNYQKIFDGNGDGIIEFGPNGILDIDRVSAKKAGADQITLVGMESKALRYLGSKEGYFVYADASVKLKGFTEGTVGDDSFDAGTGAKKYFYDTALGLNLGGDTITNFGADDRIVTTSKIHNGIDAGATITFGKNHILDLPGQFDGIKGDIGPLQGGQIDLSAVGGAAITSLHLLDHQVVNGVDYYYYGL